jgi:O-Antigen ligase
MNNHNTQALIRTAIIYVVCIPLAIWIGYLLGAPADRSTFGIAGILALILATPLLLRWHHFLLIACWNLGLTIFFLPGNPPIWLLVTALSLGFSILHRATNRNASFLSAPSITWPLLFFIAVVVGTARLRGGIGLHSLGNETAGGKNYVMVLMGILGYFALTAQQVPPQRAKLFAGLFFLVGCISFISDLAPFLPSSLYFIFAFFPVSAYDLDSLRPGAIDFNARYAGTGAAGMAGFLFMLVRYGPRGIFLSGRLWRPVLFVLFATLIFFGGFRSNIILCGMVLLIQCYLERLHHTKAFPLFVFAGVIAAVLLVSFANKLPYTFQRALAFLPLNIDPVARMDAEGSADWRLQVWKDALPTVPQYLLLGRGYALSQDQLQSVNIESFTENVDVVGNYHSGPLSVIIYFGIWGTIALLWFWIASLRALYCNYRYGDPGIRVINIFLLAYFIANMVEFLIIFGALSSGLYLFTAIIGLSVSINGGIRKPVAAKAAATAQSPVPDPIRPRFQPYFPQ